jgi:hypothetical protein
VIPPSDLVEESSSRNIPLYSRQIDEEEDEDLLYDDNQS